MKVTSTQNSSGKDRKRKNCAEQVDDHERTKVPQSASRRHREKINATLEELGGLLPLSEESKSKLDKLTVLKLSVSFFQTQNYLQSGKRKRRVDDSAVTEITNKLAACNINVSDISLEALDSFFIVLSDSGDVFFVSENVYRYLGYTQTFLMHQNFLNFVHHEDVLGFEKSLKQAAKARIIELDDSQIMDCDELEEQPLPQVCFCSIRCHAGRQSSHVSPFYYRSFKFDGKIKPLLNGKMKQYGFFALCTPVNPANPFTSTPKEILQMYSCKLSLDLKVKKLDNRGQKSLFLNEKDILSQSGYMFCHPDDGEIMMMCHQQVTRDGESSEIVFRLMNGQNNWQWIRGKARLLYDKNNQPEYLVTDNVLLNDEQGPYFRTVTAELLREWKSTQMALSSPETEDEKRSRDSSPDSALPPSSAGSGSLSSTGQGLSAPSVESEVPDSKDIEIIEFSSPSVSLEEAKAEILPSLDHATVSPPLGHATSASESCMFGSRQLNSSPVDEKPNIVSRDGLIVNLKAEPINGDTSHAHSQRNHNAHDRINRIKQFLMGEDDRPPPNSCQLGGPVRIDGGFIRDSPVQWHNYPVDGSSVLPDLKFQQDDISSVLYPQCPPQQNGKQPLLTADGFDHIPDILQGRGNGLQLGGSQQLDASNYIYPFLPDISNYSNATVLNPCSNKVNNHDTIDSDTNVYLAMNGFNKTPSSELDSLPGFLGPNGTANHVLQHQQRLIHGQNGFYPHPQRKGNYQTVTELPNQKYAAYDFLGHASATGISGQDPNLWHSATQSNPNTHHPRVDDVIKVDDLTPTLFADPVVSYGNLESLHTNGRFVDSMHTQLSNVYTNSEMNMNHAVGQNVQTPQNLPQKRASENVSQNFQPGSNNSILKMMLSL